ncbi:MAG: hypothetical protein HKP30_17775, partial [Myxococcales bacterium]|nr:hypothetical protein [Myxococcales bacterium]
MADRPRVLRSADPETEGGRLLAEALLRLDPGRTAPRLAIPGGSAARALAAARAGLADAWRDVRLTWVDERCVPFASPESNRGNAYRAGLLDAADAPACELPLFLDGESGDDAVARVASALDAGFDGRLDVLLLGMG